MSAQERVVTTLDQLFRSGHTRFHKLRGSGSPYSFSKWAKDRLGRPCLYYQFPSRDGKTKNEKRIPIDELLTALKEISDKRRLTRTAFKRVCPVAESDGPCGFAVVGRCFELLGIAGYSGRQEGFELTDTRRAKELLGQLV